MRQEGGRLTFLAAAAIILILDQLTKRIAISSQAFKEGFEIIPGLLWLRTTFNTGAAFSILQNQNTLLAFFTVAVIGIIIYYAMRNEIAGKYSAVSLGLILGGALGNLTDRIISGAVIDFISFPFWPAFNIADSALTL